MNNLATALSGSTYDLLRCLRPFPGRVVVALYPSPATTTSGLHVPQQAQSHGIELNVQPGEVLAVTPRKAKVMPFILEGHWAFREKYGYETFGVGDRVLVLMRLEDVDREVIVTRCERIVAVLEPKP